MIHLLRRSAPIATAAAGGGAPAALRTLAAAILSFSSAAGAGAVPAARTPASASPRFGAARCRDLHSSAGPVGFRASDAAQAAPAVEFYDEAPAAVQGLDIAGLGIAQDIVDKLARKNITQLFPIQKAVLEPAMQGRDMIGRAKTGTGKTLAFGIPILDKIIQFQKKHGRGKSPLALVLAPTRELAKQVEKELQESASVDTLCVYGGSPIQQQMRALDYGVDVVVGTPGRVIDLLNRGALVLADVQFLVLDEADEMLNVGFAVAVENILEKLPLQQQSLMFSATMPPSIRNLTRKYLSPSPPHRSAGVSTTPLPPTDAARPLLLTTLVAVAASSTLSPMSLASRSPTPRASSNPRTAPWPILPSPVAISKLVSRSTFVGNSVRKLAA